MTSTLRFPSEGNINAYLQQHPLTKDQSLIEKNIIQTAAKIFADQEKPSLSVDMLVNFMLQNLNRKLEPSEKISPLIQKNLITALKDCANGKEISVDFQFPSESIILAYLERHPSIQDPRIKESGIIQALAKQFAEKVRPSEGVEMGVSLKILDHGLTAEMSENGVERALKNLVTALKDCANGKEI